MMMGEMITLTESEYNTMEDEANKMAGSITRLAKERDELREALTDMSANSDHFAEQLFLRTRERDALKGTLKTLRRIIFMNEILHMMMGECPSADQPDARDDGCIGCVMLMRIDEALAAPDVGE